MKDRDAILLEQLYTREIINESRIDTAHFVHIKHLGGSTGADLYMDRNTGKEWVVKGGNSVGHMYNEYISNKLYNRYGINAPEAHIGIIDGREVLVTEFLKDSIPLATAVAEGKHLNVKSEVGRGFLVDVILANWDVVGTSMSMDNIRVTPDSKVWRVDTGGSLIYRAQGALKGKAFGDTPSEHNTLRDPNVGYAAKFFKDISDEDIKIRIKDEAKRYIVSGDQISHVKFLRELRTAVYDTHYDVPEETKQQIYRTLAKRVFSLYRLFN